MNNKEGLILYTRKFTDEIRGILSRRSGSILRVRLSNDKKEFGLLFAEERIILTVRDKKGNVQTFVETSPLNEVSVLRLLCRGLASFI